MEIRHLKYFRAVADARSFVHGARSLRVAQPALSRAIAQLEKEIGRALFVRHSGGVSLTDAGSVFYEQAMAILEQTQQLHERMAEEGALRGNITLGAPQSIQSKVVAPVIAAFLKRFSQCSVDLVQDSSGRLRDGIVEGAIDVAIISRQAVEGGLHQTPLLTEGFCLFAPKD
jgi:LysR family nitrogen assimilation transcriptional regulator